EDFEFAERCLQKLADIAAKELHLHYAEEPGAGAAGGLGFGLRCFAGARLEAGVGLFARLASLPGRPAGAQLVVTGEGSIDQSTLMGKGVGELARLCRELGVPCLGLAGVVPNPTEANQLFSAAYALVPDVATSAEAMAQPGRCLERLAAQVA